MTTKHVLFRPDWWLSLRKVTRCQGLLVHVNHCGSVTHLMSGRAGVSSDSGSSAVGAVMDAGDDVGRAAQGARTGE